MQNSFTGIVVAAAIVLILGVGILIRMGDSEEATSTVTVARRAERELRPLHLARNPVAPEKTADSTRDRPPVDAEQRQSMRDQMRNRVQTEPRAQEGPADRPGAETDVDIPSPIPAKEKRDVADLENTLLNNPDPDERLTAVFFLGTAEEDEAIRILSLGMADADPEVRLAVVEALSDFSEQLPASTLAPAMADPDPEVRREAAQILSEMDSREAQDILRKAWDDPDEDVRDMARGEE